MVVSALLRFVGLGFSSRTPWGRPDEEIFVHLGLGLSTDPTPHHARAGWPDLFFRVHHWVQEVLSTYYAYAYGEDVHLGCLFAVSPWRLLVPVRFVSALFSTATVALLMHVAYRGAPRLSGPHARHASALLAGLFYGTNVLAARDGHFAVSDTFMVFLYVWLCDASVRASLSHRLFGPIESGIAFGLALSTKWTAIAFGMPPVLGLLTTFRRRGWSWRSVVALLLGVGATAAAFALSSHGVFEEPADYWFGIRTHIMRYQPTTYMNFSYAAHPVPVWGMWQHVITSLPFAWGWPLTIVVIVAVFWAVIEGLRTKDVWLFFAGAFPLVFHFVVLGKTTLNFARYSFPEHPIGCLAAAFFLVTIGERVRRRLAKVSPASFGVSFDGPGSLAFQPRLLWPLALGVVLTVEPLHRSLDFVRLMSLPETRDLATDWILEHVGEQPIVSLGGYARLYAVDDQLADACLARLPEALRVAVPRIEQPDTTSSVSRDRSTWKPIAGQAVYATLFGGAAPPLSEEYVVQSYPYMPCGGARPHFDQQELPSCFHEVATFEPGNVDCDAVYDDQDHYYAPLWSRDPLTNPGPRVVILHNECVRRP